MPPRHMPEVAASVRSGYAVQHLGRLRHRAHQIMRHSATRHLLRGILLGTCALALGACAETKLAAYTAKEVSGSADDYGKIGRYKIGKPYQIAGRWYYPQEDWSYAEDGVASWYGPNFHGKYTANGETYDQNSLTAAHRTLPMPSLVRVTNLDNGRSLVVRVNDRGPFAKDRIIDMSRRGAQLLGYLDKGTARVRVEILREESLALKTQAQSQPGSDIDEPIVVAAPRGAVETAPLDGPGVTVTASAGPVQARGALSLVSPAQAAAPATPVRAMDVIPVGPGPSADMASGGRSWVQAGAFSDRYNAESLRQRLASIHDVTISSVVVDGRELYRVRLGPVADGADSERVLQAVRAAGLPGARVVTE